jgi:hypothetical protein
MALFSPETLNSLSQALNDPMKNQAFLRQFITEHFSGYATPVLSYFMKDAKGCRITMAVRGYFGSDGLDNDQIDALKRFLMTLSINATAESSHINEGGAQHETTLSLNISGITKDELLTRFNQRYPEIGQKSQNK